jgi:hypothetical protein
MKKIIFVGIAFMMATMVASAQDQNQNQNKKNDKKLPAITFKETEFDFGTINYGASGTHEFQFKNTGKEPLIVSNVGTSCGCTVPDWTKDPVNKNKTGVITATYDTKRIGPFTKTLTVTSNAKNTPVTLTIKGTVKAPENK